MDGTIIVADDDKSIRTVLAQALTRAGCRVRSTGTISTLWRWLEDGEGDVLVTDVMMPDGDTLDILPVLKRKRPNLPIIVMSAQNTVLTAIRANETGAYEYLPKPFDLKEVLRLVHKALDRNSTNKAARFTANEHDNLSDSLNSLPLIGSGIPYLFFFSNVSSLKIYDFMDKLLKSDLEINISLSLPIKIFMIGVVSTSTLF